MDFSLVSSSRPRKYIVCPVLIYLISSGDTLHSNSSISPSSLIAHFILAYTESFRVPATCLVMQACICGLFLISSTILKATKEDFRPPRPPSNTYSILGLICRLISTNALPSTLAGSSYLLSSDFDTATNCSHLSTACIFPLIALSYTAATMQALLFASSSDIPIFVSFFFAVVGAGFSAIIFANSERVFF